MFHHFHGGRHLPSQGSLSAAAFSDMLDWLDARYNLLGAGEYLRRFESGALGPRDICLSFDDGLLCQYDIAVPVLEERNLDAFFFVYSSVIMGLPNNLEIYRHFRTHGFRDIDEFYAEFFALAEDVLKSDLSRHRRAFEEADYLREFPFYTESDKWFRYLRDQVLGPERYDEIMTALMERKAFSPQDVMADLWMSESHLKDLAARGHIVGLHSFSHPTKISRLDYDQQYAEYRKNYDHLTSVVGSVSAMSHPCGDYNDDTLKILAALGIRIGFRSNMSRLRAGGPFEVPREDHANIVRAMNG
ncbi:MAG: polysaccharide deacetylase family protein [Verrucomicrobia bacterium]|nr:MAG: polysaccharide deacetylase family protein [Verrucomicrobiota bacterium]